ncbi:hypothetical protein SEUCBS140593_007125 [Sporothrix eucalyptigena]|uniref:Cyclohexanone monooxygenase n=1 Tax=Sporothrix eucalyptigena TaxID=1812306 RepID=A0ABP0CAZ1_9PEZI
MSSQKETRVDAVVVGAGFGGVYQTYSFKSAGYSVRCIERAPTAGGVWYWNRYPGAMSDTESYLYRYSWDKEDLLTYPWPNRYVTQPEILKYLNHVVDKHNLRESMQFNTSMESATWDAEQNLWHVVCDTGDVFAARYLVTAMGALSEAHFPQIAGLNSFAGRLLHTQDWPDDIDLTGKTVAVIGSGSTGVQLMTAIAPRVKRLVSFQRSPQHSVPTGQGPVSEEERKEINANYDKIYEKIWQSNSGFLTNESDRPMSSYTPEQRQEIFEWLWQQGNAFRFNMSKFSDITTNEEANRETAKFIEGKIAQIVKDPKKAKALTPKTLYHRRPLCDTGYYYIFNQDHVDIVDLRETPIESIVPEGIRTKDGTVHELDVLIFATGFDALEGTYARTKITGRDGHTIAEHWKNGPSSFAGVSMAGFPNMFMVFGPQGPMSNGATVVEVEVRFIMQLIANVEKSGAATESGAKKPKLIEVKPEVEAQWRKLCDKEAETSILKKATNSWIFGTNVPGRKPIVTFYFPGLKGWLEITRKEAEQGFPSYM